jgi:hypothetical protein
MKLALQPVRRKLRAKPTPLNLSICARSASIDSTIGTLRTLSIGCLPVLASRSKFFGYRSRDAKGHASKPFRMNTCESVSKQRTLTTFRINTYRKRGRGGCSPSLRGNRFVRPLFSYSYKSLFPQLLSFHIHAKPPGVWGATVSERSDRDTRKGGAGPGFRIPYFEILAMKTE